MKLYDRFGNTVGTVRKEDLVTAEDAIMPVPITIKPARKFSFPSAYTVMGIGSVIAACATILSFGSKYLSEDAYTFFVNCGLLHRSAVMVCPLAAVIWLFASVLLSFERKIYALPSFYFLVTVILGSSDGLYAICTLLAYILLVVIFVIFRKSKPAYMLIGSRVLLSALMAFSWNMNIVVMILMLNFYLVEVLYFFAFANDNGKAAAK